MEGKKILIIDDEIDFGFLMKETFSKKGYTVLLANTMEEALEILKEETPDFIFLDNDLPDGFGWSKTQFILINHPNSQLILISGMDVPKTTSSSFRILHKPFVKDELNRILEPR
ncbi:MAG TPA: response regulator [Cyclobacteriaceae bacterium]|jgi:DNA-binding NtrC family response regulator|nr:response regulator [Cyclobacteriaceae bacterium]